MSFLDLPDWHRPLLPPDAASVDRSGFKPGWAAEGYKADHDKDPWHLLPWDAVRCIVKILAFGAKKYSDRNWEKGMAWSRPYAALIRHLTDWWGGDGKDPETGYSHLWHAGCCILFLIAFELRGSGKDDRPGAGNG